MLRTALWSLLLSHTLLSVTALEAQFVHAEADAELRRLMASLRTRKYDRIPAIDRPEFVPAAAAAAFLRPGYMVIGVYRDGVAKAYPVQFLDGREVVNDSLAGRPLTVTW